MLQVTTNIAIQQQASELQALLRDMGGVGSIIDNAFLRFSSYALALLDVDAPQNQRDEAAQKMFALLTDKNDQNGPTALVNAITVYQQKVIGSSDGAQGLIDLIPAVMVKGAWESCGMQLPSKVQSRDVRGAWPRSPDRQSMSPYTQQADGPFRDSPTYLWDTCVNQVYTSLQDPTYNARSVERIFASILDKPIKATTLLLNMYPESDTADALVVQQVLQSTQLMGQRMASLWGQITDKDFVNPTGAAILNQFGAQLGAPRADGSWWPWNGVDDYFGKLNHHPQDFPGRPESIQPGPVTFDCGSNLFPATYRDIFRTFETGEACALRTTNIKFDESGLKTAPLPAMAFQASQYVKTQKQSTTVLAPFCYCSGEDCYLKVAEECRKEFGNAYNIAQVYGQAVYDDHDVKGKKCGFGYGVPWCEVEDRSRVEYIYVTAETSLPSPYSNLPKSAPKFLQDIMAAYPPTQH